MFCDVELAREIERAESQLMAACAEAARTVEAHAFVRPVAGGFATYAGADSPFTKVSGLGFAGLPAAGELDVLEAAYAECDVPVQVELASLARHELGLALSERGYRLVSFENVLGHQLDAGRRAPAPPPGLTVAEVSGELETWLSVMVEASVAADDQGLASHEDFSTQALAVAEAQLLESGARPYLARLDGDIVGGGSLRVAGRVAQLGGAATLPAYRRRGVQSALIAHRLDAAAAAGCKVAVVTTQPGSKSQQNVQRAGFELLYVRAVLVKDGLS